MGRTKGSKNKPKIPELSPELAKLAHVAMDTSLDADTRAAASNALATALKPTVPAQPGQCPKGAPYAMYGFVGGCNPFDSEPMCPACEAERLGFRAIGEARRVTREAEAEQAAKAQALDTIDLDAELAALEEELS